MKPSGTHISYTLYHLQSLYHKTPDNCPLDNRQRHTIWGNDSKHFVCPFAWSTSEPQHINQRLAGCKADQNSHSESRSLCGKVLERRGSFSAAAYIGIQHTGKLLDRNGTLQFGAHHTSAWPDIPQLPMDTANERYFATANYGLRSILLHHTSVMKEKAGKKLATPRWDEKIIMTVTNVQPRAAYMYSGSTLNRTVIHNRCCQTGGLIVFKIVVT